MSVTVGPPTTERARVWSARLTFVVLGAIFGSWASRVPDVATQAHVSAGTLGGVLFSIAIGSLLGIPLASRALRRHSIATVTTASGALLGLGAATASSARGLDLLVVACLVFGTANGVYGIAINTAATMLESELRRPLLSSCHASFSLATLAAAGGGGLALSLHLTPVEHVGLVSVTVVLVGVVASRGVNVGHSEPSARRLPIPRGRRVWIAAGVGFAALFAEGSVTDWSAYFVGHAITHGPSPQQPWAYGMFAAAMAAGRACGDTVRRRIAPSPFVLGCLVLAISGYVVAMPAQHILMALLGFAGVGLGLSNLYPTMISSAAADGGGETRDDAVAAVSSIAYIGFLLGPVVIGPLVAPWGIRLALAVPGMALLVAVPAARSFRTHP